MILNHETWRERLARRLWLLLMTGSPGGRLYLPEYPELLAQRHLENCRVACHREELLTQLALPDRPCVAEIGVFRGDFSQALLDRLHPARLHLFDLDFASHGVGRRLAAHIARGVVHLHEGDSSSQIAEFPDGHFDLIYIDGDHSYDGVKRDIAASVPRLAPAGYLVFNDYTFWSPCEQMAYGIMRAVNEFCRREDWEATHFALDGYMYCDLAVRRRVAGGASRPT